MKARFLKAAQRELDEAIEYYEAQVPGLGAELLKGVRAAMERIEQYSEAWHAVSKRSPDAAQRNPGLTTKPQSPCLGGAFHLFDSRFTLLVTYAASG